MADVRNQLMNKGRIKNISNGYKWNTFHSQHLCFCTHDDDSKTEPLTTLSLSEKKVWYVSQYHISAKLLKWHQKAKLFPWLYPLQPLWTHKTSDTFIYCHYRMHGKIQRRKLTYIVNILTFVYSCTTAAYFFGSSPGTATAPGCLAIIVLIPAIWSFRLVKIW